MRTSPLGVHFQHAYLITFTQSLLSHAVTFSHSTAGPYDPGALRGEWLPDSELKLERTGKARDDSLYTFYVNVSALRVVYIGFITI